MPKTFTFKAFSPNADAKTDVIDGLGIAHNIEKRFADPKAVKALKKRQLPKTKFVLTTQGKFIQVNPYKTSSAGIQPAPLNAARSASASRETSPKGAAQASLAKPPQIGRIATPSPLPSEASLPPRGRLPVQQGPSPAGPSPMRTQQKPSPPTGKQVGLKTSETFSGKVTKVADHTYVADSGKWHALCLQNKSQMTLTLNITLSSWTKIGPSISQYAGTISVSRNKNGFVLLGQGEAGFRHAMDSAWERSSASYYQCVTLDHFKAWTNGDRIYREKASWNPNGTYTMPALVSAGGHHDERQIQYKVSVQLSAKTVAEIRGRIDAEPANAAVSTFSVGLRLAKQSAPTSQPQSTRAGGKSPVILPSRVSFLIGPINSGTVAMPVGGAIKQLPVVVNLVVVELQWDFENHRYCESTSSKVARRAI